MKGLGPRAYNILFHTHTVSGIVISAVLFVLFFAGAVSLYKQEFYQWENPTARTAVKSEIDYEHLFMRLDSIKPGVRNADEIRIVMPTVAKPVYTVYVPVTDSLESTEYSTFIYHPQSNQITEPATGTGSTAGETLYRLHFLDQIPLYIGRYLAGFVSLFFAFAILTGLLIHWKNLKAKFFAFSFKQARKQFWTNSHTVFATLGLPFQLMYAITGAFYMLSLFVLAPAVMISYQGDQQKLITEIYPSEAFHSHDGHEAHAHAAHMPILQGLRQIKRDYPAYEVSYLELINPGKSNAALGAELIAPDGFNRNGTVVLNLLNGKYKLKIDPGARNYAQSLLTGISKLHFGSFGGWMAKAIYFLLSMLTCFVIISGVLIWKEARNKPSYSASQRKFHHRVTMIYLAACFGLFPATALLFIAEQALPNNQTHVDDVNAIFFYGWLAIALLGYFLKTEKRLTQYTLLFGGILGIMVPIANGLATGAWIWETAGEHPYVFTTDLVWLISGVLSVVSGVLLYRNRN